MSSLGDVMVVGLTGQTGAGKSTVSRVFVEGGFQLIDADQVCRKVQQKGSRCLADLLDFFPKEILQEDGELNRKVLGEIVFTDRSKLEMLNTICYPYIMGEILRQIRMYTAQGKKLILLDAPTLFESRADDFCDVIISVVSEESLRQQRIIARDHISKDAALHRMRSQLPESFFRSHSDFIIDNDTTLEELQAVAQEVVEKVVFYYQNQYGISVAALSRPIVSGGSST